MTLTLLTQSARSSVYRRSDGAQPVVVKLLAPNAPADRALRLDNELYVTQHLDVRGVRRAIRRERGADGPSLILEWVPGRPLTPGRPTRRQLLRLLGQALQLTRILGDLHDRQLLHLDIRTDNVIYDEESGTLTLIDFDRAMRSDLRVRLAGRSLDGESPVDCIAPEQTGRTNRRPDVRTDLYGLGATLYSLLAGRPPFVADDPVELIHAHLARRPEPPSVHNPEVPELLDRIVLKLLEKESEARYASARGLWHDLDQCRLALEQGRVPSFELGQRDASLDLEIPSRLFGRREELARLLVSYEQASAGRTEPVLVTGGPGVGKSALVEELRRRAGEDRAIFAVGKCDPLHSTFPYYALSQALGSAVNQLLLEPDAELEIWRSEAHAAVGDLGRVVADIVPHLGRLLGDLPAVPRLSGQEAEARLQHVLVQLIGALGKPGRPLTLVIDDLQWGDVATRRILELLAGEPSIPFVLLVGVSRDVAEGDDPVAAVMPDRARRLALGPLGIDEVSELLAATLRRAPDDVAQLARIAADRTLGNPLALRQFVEALHVRGLLVFDPIAYRWTWSEDAVAGAAVTDDVVEMMLESMRQLPEGTLALLQRAATLGGRFDLEALTIIEGSPQRDIAEVLTPAWSRGLIEPQDEGFHRVRVTQPGDTGPVISAMCAFSHDRVHQAAYASIPPERLASAHAETGRRLLAGLPPERQLTYVFDLVSQLTRGLSELSRAERHELARLCLVAGERAAQDAAFEQALGHYAAGLEALGAEGWSVDHPLTLELSGRAAQCAALSARHDQARRYASAVTERVRSPIDATLAYDSLLMTANAEDRLDEVIEIGLRALKPLGITFPRDPGLPQVVLGLLRTRLALRGRPPETLADLPEMTSREMEAAMLFMERMVPAAFRTGSKLFPLLVFELVRCSLRHGNMRVSCFAYASYAITLAGVLGDAAVGLRFGDLSLALVERLGARSHEPQVLFVYENFLRPQSSPLLQSLPGLKRAFEIGPGVGNVFDAVWAGVYRTMWRFIGGHPLEDIADEIGSHAGVFGKEVGALSLANLLRETIDLLRRPVRDPARLSGTWFDEPAALVRYEHIAERTEAAVYHTFKVMLAVLFGSPADAEPHAARAEELAEALTGLPYLPVLHFYSALARLRVVSRGGSVPRAARRSLKRLRRWAERVPADHRHRVELLEAEIARIRGKAAFALERYSAAVEAARRSGCLQEEALACELAGQEHGRAGRATESQAFLTAAAAAYRDWGAFNKLDRLSPQARALPAARGALGQRRVAKVEMMDAVALTKAAAAMTSEIVLDKLLNRLVDIVAENAGAGRGALVLMRDTGPWVEAWSDLRGTKRGPRAAVPLADATNLSVRAVQFVLRTEELLLVEDALDDPRFSQERYVLEGRVRSIICAPIRQQGRAVGAFYLENDTLPGAFTAERALVLELLAAPAAIALENARLYDRLSRALQIQTQLNEAHRRFVPHEFLESFNRESITDVQLGDSVVKEMTVLFCDVRGFTTMAERLSPVETVGFLNTFLARMEPPVFRHGGLIDSYVGDSLIALFDSPDGALRAALAMLAELDLLNRDRVAGGEDPVRIGIGINTGTLTMATLGGQTRMKCTVIGDSVNVASRIEGLTRTYGVPVLISDRTWEALAEREAFCLRQVDRVRVRGRHQEVGLYEVYDHEPPGVKASRRRTADSFGEARAHFDAGRPARAAALFGQCVQQPHGDPVAAFWLERCQSALLPDDSKPLPVEPQR